MTRFGPQMRVLICGGGIAGLTLAALLRLRGGEAIDVVEKSPHYGGVGYVLGLWPAGGNVLKELGVFERVLERSIPADAYAAYDRKGRVIIDAGFEGVIPRIEDARLIDRAALLEIVRNAAGVPVRFGTTVERIGQQGDGVEVAFSDGSAGHYDCVIGADGVHSRVRELCFEPVPLRYSGLSGWAFWTKPAFKNIREFYGDGIFAGFYPAKDLMCCFAIIAGEAGTAKQASSLAEIRGRFAALPQEAQRLFDAADPAQRLWRDDFYDVRSRRWANGRIALLGDAAAAMLPTAGVGASMAIESAITLAQELSLSDSRSTALALENYERRRRSRVTRIQTQSRGLTWLVRVRGPFASMRDAIFRRTSTKMLARSFSSVLYTSV